MAFSGPEGPADARPVAAFDLPGVVRRIRRASDLSQRELARRLSTSKTTIAAVEKGDRGLDAGMLAQAAQLAGFRLALIDASGREVVGMDDSTVRDSVGRRFPAHLDTRYGDIDWWHGDSRYSREQPSYTFDRVRETRDLWRGRLGTPEDHQLPQPGDSPQERRAARQRAAAEKRRQELERLREAGELPERAPFTCECPPECDELDDWSGKPVHAPECGCGCDLGGSAATVKPCAAASCLAAAARPSPRSAPSPRGFARSRRLLTAPMQQCTAPEERPR